MGKDRCGLKASLLEFGGRGEEGVGGKSCETEKKEGEEDPSSRISCRVKFKSLGLIFFQERRRISPSQRSIFRRWRREGAKKPTTDR